MVVRRVLRREPSRTGGKQKRRDEQQSRGHRRARVTSVHEAFL
jgi:hypothetical protein